jgi:hypothetical protein
VLFSTVDRASLTRHHFLTSIFFTSKTRKQQAL